LTQIEFFSANLPQQIVLVDTIQRRKRRCGKRRILRTLGRGRLDLPEFLFWQLNVCGIFYDYDSLGLAD